MRRLTDWADKVRQAIDERDRGSLEGWHRAQRSWSLQRRVLLAELQRLRAIAERHRHTLGQRGVELEVTVIDPPVSRPRYQALPAGSLEVRCGEAHLVVHVVSHGQLLPLVRIRDENGRSMGSDLEFAIRLWTSVSLKLRD